MITFDEQTIFNDRALQPIGFFSIIVSGFCACLRNICLPQDNEVILIYFPLKAYLFFIYLFMLPCIFRLQLI